MLQAKSCCGLFRRRRRRRVFLSQSPHLAFGSWRGCLFPALVRPRNMSSPKQAVVDVAMVIFIFTFPLSSPKTVQKSKPKGKQLPVSYSSCVHDRLLFHGKCHGTTQPLYPYSRPYRALYTTSTNSRIFGVSCGRPHRIYINRGGVCTVGLHDT